MNQSDRNPLTGIRKTTYNETWLEVVRKIEGTDIDDPGFDTIIIERTCCENRGGTGSQISVHTDERSNRR